MLPCRRVYVCSVSAFITVPCGGGLSPHLGSGSEACPAVGITMCMSLLTQWRLHSTALVVFPSLSPCFLHIGRTDSALRGSLYWVTAWAVSCVHCALSPRNSSISHFKDCCVVRQFSSEILLA